MYGSEILLLLAETIFSWKDITISILGDISKTKQFKRKFVNPMELNQDYSRTTKSNFTGMLYTGIFVPLNIYYRSVIHDYCLHQWRNQQSESYTIGNTHPSFVQIFNKTFNIRKNKGLRISLLLPGGEMMELALLNCTLVKFLARKKES